MLVKALKKAFFQQNTRILHCLNLSFSSSLGTTEVTRSSKSILKPQQQKALIGYYVTRRIANFSLDNFETSSISLREYLLNKNNFFLFVLNKFRVDLRPVIDDECFDEVLDGFRIGKGAIYDRRVFSQDRFSQAETPRIDDKLLKFAQSKISANSFQTNSQLKQQAKLDSQQGINNTVSTQIDGNKQTDKKQHSPIQEAFGNIVLNPLSFTGSIIKRIITSNSLIVCGQKGAGKSFAYLIYIYCTEFIFQLRRSQQYQQQKHKVIFNYVNKFSFQYIPRLSYFPLKKKTQFTQVTEILRFQNQHIQPQQLTEKQIIQLQNSEQKIQRKILSRYMGKIENYGIKKGIRTGFVIDQANHYYQQIRKYMKNRYPYPSMEIKEKQRIQNKEEALQSALWISKLIKLGYNHFTPIILNSSQNVEAKYLSQVNKRIQHSFFDLLQHESEIVHHINYKQLLLKPAGQVELYGVMWFQIESQLSLNGQSQDTINKFKMIFKETFSLPGSTSSTQKDISFWNINVSFYDIRKEMRKKSLFQIKTYFEQNKIRDLRQQIEKNRQQMFEIHFQNFFNKGLDSEGSLRCRFLMFLKLQVEKKLKKMIEGHQEKTEITIKSPQQFGQAFFKELRQSLEIQVRKSQDMKSVKCVFPQQPPLMRDLINDSLKGLIKALKAFMVMLIEKKQITQSSVGQVYQILLNIFVRPAEVVLKMTQYDGDGKQSQLTFDIVDTQSILTQQNLPKGEKKPCISQCLKLVFESAADHPKQYVAGIPLARNHYFYDFLIAKHSSEHAKTQCLQLWLIGFAVRELRKKAADKHEELMDFISKLETAYLDYDVKVKFYLASPKQLSQAYAKFMSQEQQKNETNSIVALSQSQSTADKDKKQLLKKIEFKVIGIPKIKDFFSFKRYHIFPLSQNQSYQFIAQTELFMETFVKKSKKEDKQQ